MRRILDTTYRSAGIVAAAAIFLIFALVSLQVSARLLDGALRLSGRPPTGFLIPSIAEICGFLLAIASFLALARTLTVGGHIRVGILVERLPAGARRLTEALIGLLATGLGVYATVAVARLSAKSWTFNDVSYGFVPIPLWLPQALMALGLAILSVALVDLTVRMWRDKTFLQNGPEA